METEPQELGIEREPVPESEPTAQEYAVYVVQEGQGDGRWLDIATVMVPPRTRRRSVLEKALNDAPEHKPTLPGVTVHYRVLDAQSSEVIPASIVPPEPSDPVLRIG